MKGKILGQVQSGAWAILTSEGKREAFLPDQWRGASEPIVGQTVDFDFSEAGTVCDVFPVNEHEFPSAKKNIVWQRWIQFVKRLLIAPELRNVRVGVVVLAVFSGLCAVWYGNSGERGAVKSYLVSDSLEERLSYICASPQITMNDFNRHYTDGSWKNKKATVVDVDRESDTHSTVDVEVWKEDGESENYDFDVYKLNGAWCVDWIGDGRLNKTIREAENSGDPVDGYFRIRYVSKSSDIYILGSNDYFSVEVMGLGNFSFSSLKTAFINKGDPLAREIYAKTSGGEFMTVKATLQMVNANRHRFLSGIEAVEYVGGELR
jgi:hypothetical protein